MTNREAIEIIKIAIAEIEWNYPLDYAVAFEIAIKTLDKFDRIEQIMRRDDIYSDDTCMEIREVLME